METLVQHLWKRPSRRSGRVAAVGGAVLGLLSAVAVFAARWIRKATHARVRPRPALELDLNELLRERPPPLPLRHRADERPLLPPDVHSFEIH